MKLKVIIPNNKFFIILLVIFVFAGSFFVFAYNSGEDPGTFGHSGGEIEIDLGNGPITLNTFFTNAQTTSTLDCVIKEACWTSGEQVLGCNPNGLNGGSVSCDEGYKMMGGSCVDKIANFEAKSDSFPLDSNIQRWDCKVDSDLNGNKHFKVYGVCCK
jgi:hypothetical protein